MCYSIVVCDRALSTVLLEKHQMLRKNEIYNCAINKIPILIPLLSEPNSCVGYSSPSTSASASTWCSSSLFSHASGGEHYAFLLFFKLRRRLLTAVSCVATPQIRPSGLTLCCANRRIPPRRFSLRLFS